jgi:hypothetical protein
MARVANTSTNGIISSALIGKIINEVNSINNFLNALGYERRDDGTVDLYTKQRTSSKERTDTRGADDFKVYSVNIDSVLKKGMLDHGDIKVPLTKQKYPHAITATIQSGDIPAFATLKSISGTEMIFEITSTKRPVSGKNITLHVIVIATDTQFVS